MMEPGPTLGILALVTIAYLVLVFLILRQTQALEMKLLVLGLVTALLAVWCGQLTGLARATVTVGPEPAGGVFIGGEAAGALGRIAFLLILGSIAVGILNLGTAPKSFRREEGIREPRN